MTRDLGGRVEYLVEQLRQAWWVSGWESAAYRPLEDREHLRYLDLVCQLYRAGSDTAVLDCSAMEYVPPNRNCQRCALIDWKRRRPSRQESIQGVKLRLCDEHWRELLQVVQLYLHLDVPEVAQLLARDPPAITVSDSVRPSH